MNEMEQKEQVAQIIDMVRPYILRDGGDIELVDVEEGIVYVKMLGACVGCLHLDTTLKEGLEEMLVERVPGIVMVVAI